MLEEAKKILRLFTDVYDGEITDLINACKVDLRLAGVINIDEGDPLIKRAILTYAKANFGFDDNSESFQRRYDALKLQLRESGEYNKEV